MTPTVSPQLALFADGHWHRVIKWDRRAGTLADRHYSRQSVGSDQFMPPGRTLALMTDDSLALWAVCQNLDPVGNERWRCTIFRNEGPVLSSELVQEATLRTYRFWRRRYGGLPRPLLTTEIDPRKVRSKRDPGRCFRRAG